MKVTFIRPHLTNVRAADAMEPLVFALLAGQTPPAVEIILYDDRIEPIPFDEPTDLVAMTVETFTARRAYQIAAQYRRRGVPVVMGGYHPTLMPEEAQQYADAILIGDAEGVWPNVVRDARSSKLQSAYQATGVPALTNLKFDHRVFHGKRYARLVPVQFGRGCRFSCDFCAINAFYGANLRQRPARDVVDELKAIGRHFYLVVDDNILADLQQAEELFEALIPLRIHWACQVSIDAAANSRLVDLMKQSGCIAVIIGLESLDDRNLAQMRKGWNRQNGDYATLLKQFSERGIMVCGSFVFGYDHDTAAAFEATLDFALRSKLFLAFFNPLMPMPGTPVFDRLRAESRLIHDKWWLDPSYRYGQAMFHPKGMTAEELTEGCFRLRREFNRYGSILKRAISPQTNCRTPYHLLIHLAANWVSRKEISNKQGQQLGGCD